VSQLAQQLESLAAPLDAALAAAARQHAAAPGPLSDDARKLLAVFGAACTLSSTFESCARQLGWREASLAPFARTALVVLTAGPTALCLQQSSGQQVWPLLLAQLGVAEWCMHTVHDEQHGEAAWQQAFAAEVATPERLLPWLESVSQALTAGWQEDAASEGKCCCH